MNVKTFRSNLEIFQVLWGFAVNNLLHGGGGETETETQTDRARGRETETESKTYSAERGGGGLFAGHESHHKRDYEAHCCAFKILAYFGQQSLLFACILGKSIARVDPVPKLTLYENGTALLPLVCNNKL